VRKFLVGILTLVYFTATSGTAFNVHYCMGRIKSVQLLVNEDNLCICGSKKTTNKCCKTEVQLVKLENDHKASTVNFEFTPILAEADIIIYHVTTEFASEQVLSLYKANAPPLLPKQPIYIKNCVFLI
jgi:hypothetical protein